jgi:hypothetical protein
MKSMKSLLLAGLATLSLGISVASAQEGGFTDNSYWVNNQRMLIAQQAADEQARQAAAFKTAVDQAVDARIGAGRPANMASRAATPKRAGYGG